MDKTITTTATLNNGVTIPYFGLGVFQAGRGAETREAVSAALRAGYRHIDTARAYGNERDVGQAVRESGLPREEVFVTTKLANADQGYDSTLRAFDKSMERLGLGPIDLYLVHFPVKEVRHETWKAMLKLYEGGQVRAIGVSNYTVRHLDQLLATSPVVPAVNQVEFSPFLYQRDLLDTCRANGIQLEAYSPLVKAQRLDDPMLVSIAASHDKTPAQVLIRWALQHDLVVIPKSANEQRIYENADVFDFQLTGTDVSALDALDEGYRTSWDPTDVP